MKKAIVLFVCIIWGLSAPMAHSQDPWVGTWTSESFNDTDWENSPRDSEGSITKLIYIDYKLIIRITKNSDKYTVRAKIIKVKDPSDVTYQSAYTVTRVTENAIWLEQYEKKRPFRINGQVDSYSDITRYTKLTLNNGILHYSYYKIHFVDYDRNMIPTNEGFDDRTPKWSELDLFNDDW